MTIHVERLTAVALREVWRNEAYDFTPWLAANVEYLSEALSMDLELVGTEMGVGPFSADIVLNDTSTNRRVVVENFLEATDHDHLGKLITYASGLEASYAVLVAQRFRPEHRSALKWLNDVSGSDSGFFGIEVHAVRIGDSPPAVQLEVVVEPDDWQRQARELVSSQLSETQARYIEWWGEFLPAMQQRFPGWTNATSPPAANWMNFPAGRTGVKFGLNFAWPTGHTGYSLRAELYIDQGEKWWPVLAAHRTEIDAGLGAEVHWEELPNSKASRLALYLPDADPADVDAWPRYRKWALDTLGTFRTVLEPIVRAAQV